MPDTSPMTNTSSPAFMPHWTMAWTTGDRARAARSVASTANTLFVITPM